MARRTAKARPTAPAAARPTRPEVEHPFHVPVLAAMAALLASRPWIGTDVPAADPWRLWNTGLAAPAGLKQGLLVVMLWLVLLAVWAIGQTSRGAVRLRFGWVDAAMAALVGWHVVSGVWAVWHAAPRPAISSLWMWVGYGAAWFLVRQMVVDPRDARGLLAVMVSVALTLGAFGLYQNRVDLPLTQAEYDRNPTEALRRAGVALDSPREREAYENRLRDLAPFATFNLTNSLAGFLAPWLMVLLGVACTWPAPAPQPSAKGDSAPRASPIDWPALALAVGLAGLLMVCLLLTKSRSAWIAVAAGVLPVWWVCRGRRLPLAWAAAGLAGVALLVGMLTLTARGGLDLPIITQAFRSFRFRLEYWEASLGIVRVSPWFGCGPGNFRDAYTAFKLPQASEEVADPHNLFIEVWATAGTPALVAMLLVFLGAASTVWRARSSTTDAPPKDTAVERAPLFGALSIGALCGLCVAWLVRLTVDLPLDLGFMLAALVILPAALYGLRPWIEHGRLPPALPLTAAAVLGINLLAAGGIGFPGVSESLWLLLAVAVSAAELERTPARSPGSPAGSPAAPTWQPAALVVAALAATALGYWTAYQPVTGAYFALRQAADHPLDDKPLESAQLTDPLSDTAHMAAAELHAARVIQHLRPSGLGKAAEGDFDAFTSHAQRGLELRPQSSSNQLDVGSWYARMYAVWREPKLAEKALAHLGAAVERYPHNASIRVQHGQTLEAAGQPAAARAAAAEALRLDDLMPHRDKRLPPEQRAWAERTAAGAARTP